MAQHDDRDSEGEHSLEGLAALPYLERLTHFVRGSTRHWVAGVTVVDFRPLYSVNIHHLQSQLAREIQKIGTSTVTDRSLENIRAKLHQYTDALRDFEFIHSNRWHTHFVKDIAASRLDNGPGSKLHAALIADLNLQSPASHVRLFQDSDILGSFNPKLLQHATNFSPSLGTSRAETVQKQESQERLRMTVYRFAFAIIGGLIIVVPMIILVKGTASAEAQAVVSAAIFLFAVGVAILSSSSPENLLVATAAYAAVLVALLGNNV